MTVEGSRRTKVAVVQPSNKPTAKVAVAGITGAAATVVLYIASLLGLQLDPTVAAAIVLVVSFIAGWVKKEVLDRRFPPVVAPTDDQGDEIANLRRDLEETRVDRDRLDGELSRRSGEQYQPTPQPNPGGDVA